MALLLCFTSIVLGDDEWSVGIYVGSSPLQLEPPGQFINPVLTGDDITDVDASFVADPFMIHRDTTWHMFLEVYSDNGDIGHATSEDGLNWTYQSIVIDEDFHVSYPCVFEWQGEYYMVAETHEANAIRLYKATTFPHEWVYTGDLLTGAYRDTTVFRHGEKWWLFTTEGATRNDTLQLFYADDLLGPWQLHPLSPVVQNDPNIARPGGRVTLYDGRLFRYAQDDYPTYGNQLHAFEITDLSTTTYAEVGVTGNPILAADGLGWNASGIHHIDPHQLPDGTWLAVVDGIGDPDEPDFYGLWTSNSSDRSNTEYFDHDAIVRGDQVCIYVLPGKNVSRVSFYLDGLLHQVENSAPFDFAGTADDESCNLYDTGSLTLAEHTISAVIELDDGGALNIENTFQVFIDLDADDDGLPNTLELTNGTDPNLTDSDSDGLVDGPGGVVAAGALSGYTDSDMDGFADGELDAGTNPLKADSDGDGFNDGFEVADGTDPMDDSSFPTISDGDVSGDGVVNIADILIVTRILMGETELNSVLLSHCDIAPLTGGIPSPDGECNLGDLLVIQRTALGLR